jgi:hypothetical protein
MEACYGGTDVMERSCAVARGIDINSISVRLLRSCGARWSPVNDRDWYIYTCMSVTLIRVVPPGNAGSEEAN